MLWDRLLRGHTLGEELESEIRQGNVRLISIGGFTMTVTDSQNARLAEARLYQSLGTSLDGWVDSLLNRRCSRLLTRLLIRWPISPNQVSVLSLALGLLGVYSFWNASPHSALIGLCLYQLAVVLDHTDGEIARLKFLESSLGKWLDFSIDTVIHAGLALGIGVTASRLSGLAGTVLSIAAAAGVVMSAVVSKVVERHDGHGRLGRLLAQMANRDLFYAVVLGSLLSIWAAPPVLPWLVALLASGSHVYWVMLLLHQRRAVRRS
jgi:phosphatidylglycerophosphate synthase